MESEQSALTDLAAELRETFDQTFAAALADTSKVAVRFLKISVGGDYYALRLPEISGLFADKKVVALPSRAPDLLGIASFRGVVVPVYDLRILLGYPAGAWPRWLVLLAPDAAVGLAFDHLEGYMELAPEALAQEAGAEHRRQHVTETVRTDGIVRSVIATSSILESVRRRQQTDLTHRE